MPGFPIGARLLPTGRWLPGDLPAVKMGSRTLIDVPHGMAWLSNLPQAKFPAGRSWASEIWAEVVYAEACADPTEGGKT